MADYGPDILTWMSDHREIIRAKMGSKNKNTEYRNCQTTSMLARKVHEKLASLMQRRLLSYKKF